MRILSAGKSDIGRKRENNQDAFGMYQQEEAGLFVVADGMGGYDDGEKASQMVVSELANWWNDFSPVLFGADFRKMTASIEQTVAHANEMIYQEYNRKGICGTTVVVLFVYRNFYGVIYAGDSRCYLRRQGNPFLLRATNLKQLTVDEVWENQPDLNRKERMMQKHPNRGKLVNAVGIRKEIQCRVMTDVILPDTVFLLCSDGLYKFCPESLIGKYMKKSRNQKEIENTVDKLIGEVYENGAGDNVTVVMVKCADERCTHRGEQGG